MSDVAPALLNLSELKLNPHQIKKDSESLKYYARDWTTYFDINASCILFPESINDVQNIVLWARKFKIPLVPSGGRTGLSGAACATHFECIVSFEKMNQILSFNEIEQTVTLQPGVITEGLQNYAKEKGLYYPVDFAARGSSHIGGNIATNAGGIKVVRYGLTRDWVMSLKVITGTGELITLNNSLVKNATGLDFRHLFIGSEGILGFIVEATMRLCPPPPPCLVLVMGVPNLSSLMKIFSEFRKSTTMIAFEMLSDKALKHVMENTGLAKPLESECPFYIVSEIESPNEQSQEKIFEVFEKCLESGYLTDGVISQSEEQAKNFWRYREQISESISKYSPYKNDVSVSISQVPEFMQDLDQILTEKYPTWEVVWFGHIGDGNLHINILRPSGMPKEEFVRECQKVDIFVFESAKKFLGSISAEHGVGLTKKAFLKYTRSETEIQLMRSVKKIFDPDGIINPGKVI